MRYLIIKTVFLYLISLECNLYKNVEPPPENQVTFFNHLPSGKKISIYNIGIKDVDTYPSVLVGGLEDSIKFLIEKPSFLNIGSLNLTPVYVRPGEQIIVELDSMNRVHFINRNHPEITNDLNFFFWLDRYISNSKMGNNGLFRINETKILDSVGATQHLSSEFKQAAKLYIRYRALNNSYRSELSSKTNEMEQKKFPQNDSCIEFLPYRFSLFNYLALLRNEEHPGKTAFELDFEISKKQFSGDTKKLIMFMLLNINMNKLLSQQYYSKAFSHFTESYPFDSLTVYLEKLYNQKISIVNSVSKDISKELVVNNKSTLVRFSDVLTRNKGKLILIDFWAEYCGPCLAEIPYSRKLEKELSAENICFIYLCLDHDYDKWKYNIQQLKIDDPYQSYLISVPEESGILEYFNIKSIPRYILIGKDGRSLSVDAPRPSDPKLKELINDNL